MKKWYINFKSNKHLKIKKNRAKWFKIKWNQIKIEKNNKILGKNINPRQKIYSKLLYEVKIRIIK